ncbi:MAG: helix-turn-helix transcriptional regulator [Clostridia bacterium]|nr:helix-turn-helix transcriptional regulator [Clostridia bacterium]
MKEYWEILRELREDHDLRQADIATLLHTTQQVYSRYEKGVNEMPIRHLRTLCQFYGVSADYVLGLPCKEK